MKELRRKLNRPLGLPAPAPLLELGAIFIRTETELILKSRWVLPDRLEKAGYSFHYPTIQETLEDIL